MSIQGYTASIIDSSWVMTALEKVAFKVIDDAVMLDEVAENPFVLSPKAYYVVQIHNEKSDNKDYTKFVIIDTENVKYVTGSETFWNSFMDIYRELEGEEFKLKVYKKDSKNYKGKQFITCNVVV